MNNYLKTTILFAVITALLMLVGYALGGARGATYFFLFSAAMNFVMYWFSDSFALSMARAQPLDRAQAPQVYEDVEELSRVMGIPMPALHISDDMQPNAFATGRSYTHSAVCITRGLTQLLTREEIRGVLAHELGHIKNRDVLISTIAAVMAGAISSLAHIGMFMGGDDEDRNPVFAILAMILAPIAAGLIQMAISRTREYAADHTGAHFSGKPADLASALLKIESAAKQLPLGANPALASLYIQNPFSGGQVAEWFSTHPLTENRVKRLQEVK